MDRNLNPGLTLGELLERMRKTTQLSELNELYGQIPSLLNEKGLNEEEYPKLDGIVGERMLPVGSIRKDAAEMIRLAAARLLANTDALLDDKIREQTIGLCKMPEDLNDDEALLTAETIKQIAVSKLTSHYAMQTGLKACQTAGMRVWEIILYYQLDSILIEDEELIHKLDKLDMEHLSEPPEEPDQKSAILAYIIANGPRLKFPDIYGILRALQLTPQQESLMFGIAGAYAGIRGDHLGVISSFYHAAEDEKGNVQKALLQLRLFAFLRLNSALFASASLESASANGDTNLCIYAAAIQFRLESLAAAKDKVGKKISFSRLRTLGQEVLIRNLRLPTITIHQVVGGLTEDSQYNDPILAASLRGAISHPHLPKLERLWTEQVTGNEVGMELLRQDEGLKDWFTFYDLQDKGASADELLKFLASGPDVCLIRRTVEILCNMI